MDINKDGGVSENEYLAFVWGELGERDSKKGFKQTDTNGDGKLSLEEYENSPHGYQSHGNSKMQMLKAKGEKADFTEFFAKVDKNSDQFIDLDEYLVADAEWLTKADSNGDGQCSSAEWMHFRKINHVIDANEDTFTEENFAKLDKDSNGELTPLEYHKGMQQMAADMMANGYRL